MNVRHLTDIQTKLDLKHNSPQGHKIFLNSRPSNTIRNQKVQTIVYQGHLEGNRGSCDSIIITV